MSGKIHSVEVKPRHKGRTNEGRFEEREGEGRGNGLHMDLKARRHGFTAVKVQQTLLLLRLDSALSLPFMVETPAHLRHAHSPHRLKSS